MSLDELVCMILKEMQHNKVPDGYDMPVTIRSEIEDYRVADFTIRKDEHGKFFAVIEMGDSQP